MKPTCWLSCLAILMIGAGGASQAWSQVSPEPKTKPISRPANKGRPPGARPKDAPATAPTPAAVTAPVHGSNDHPLVEFEIVCNNEPWGSIIVEVFPERTPITVRNFLDYVDSGFYDGTIFHRVLPDFLIQGGGYTGPNEPKTEGLRGAIRNESRRGSQNARGSIAMARKKDAHSAVCQFFINLADNPQLDFPKCAPYAYCAFGTVIEGMSVVDRIKDVPTQVSPDAQKRFERWQAQGRSVTQPEKSLPLAPPMIRKAHRLERAEYERRAGHSVETTPAPESPAGTPPAEPVPAAPAPEATPAPEVPPPAEGGPPESEHHDEPPPNNPSEP